MVAACREAGDGPSGISKFEDIRTLRLGGFFGGT
jgi:hypothetical protein